MVIRRPWLRAPHPPRAFDTDFPVNTRPGQLRHRRHGVRGLAPEGERGPSRPSPGWPLRVLGSGASLLGAQPTCAISHQGRRVTVHQAAGSASCRVQSSLLHFRLAQHLVAAISSASRDFRCTQDLLWVPSAPRLPPNPTAGHADPGVWADLEVGHVECAVRAADACPSPSPGHTTATTSTTQSRCSALLCSEARQKEKGGQVQYFRFFFFFLLLSLTVTVPKPL